jgi:hypothetical protein
MTARRWMACLSRTGNENKKRQLNSAAASPLASTIGLSRHAVKIQPLGVNAPGVSRPRH